MLGRRLGPKQSFSKLDDDTLSRNVFTHIANCEAYVGGLSLFKRYCIFIYTLGSASINRYLIFGPKKEFDSNSAFWVKRFIMIWVNTNGDSINLALNNTPRDWNIIREYIKNINFYDNLSISNKINVYYSVISLYFETLEMIILGSPSTPGPVKAWKVASPYPGLPEANKNFQPTQVIQEPFNSCTISPTFNPDPFIAESRNSVVFDMNIVEGSKALYIPTDLHAYGYIEREIILPHGTKFNIVDFNRNTSYYIPKDTINIERIQGPDIQMGTVYQISEYHPCNTGICQVLSDNFVQYVTNVVS